MPLLSLFKSKTCILWMLMLLLCTSFRDVTAFFLQFVPHEQPAMMTCARGLELPRTASNGFIRITSLASTPFSGSGWDNDNFLDSLSKPQQNEPPSGGPPTFETNSSQDNDAVTHPSSPSLPTSPLPRQEQHHLHSPSIPPSPIPIQQHQKHTHPPFQQYQEQHHPYPQIDPMIPLTEDDVDHIEDNDDMNKLPTGDVEGTAPLSHEVKAKIKERNELPQEEASQGGERFRKLMERAKLAAAAKQQTHQEQSQPHQQTWTSPPYSQSPPLHIPPNAFSLPIEEQARLFRELLARQQMQLPQQQNQHLITTLQPRPQTPSIAPGHQQYASPPPTAPTTADTTYQQQYEQILMPPTTYQRQPLPPPYQPNQDPQSPVIPQQHQTPLPLHPPPHQPYVVPQTVPTMDHHPQLNIPRRDHYLQHGEGFDHRKMGRNRDADTIANSADAYLAKLKWDSTTRNLARYAGNEQKANEVFHDPAIPLIQPPLSNPHREEQKRREQDMFETIPEEMLVFQEYDKSSKQTAVDKSYSGVSYKQRLELLRAKNGINK